MPKGREINDRLKHSGDASTSSSVRLAAAAHSITPCYSEAMLTQVIAIDYGSKDRLHEILEGILGEENFKLVQRISNQWQIKLVRRLTNEEIGQVKMRMMNHYLPTI